jgi:hypothetical protein
MFTFIICNAEFPPVAPFFTFSPLPADGDNVEEEEVQTRVAFFSYSRRQWSTRWSSHRFLGYFLNFKTK